MDAVAPIISIKSANTVQDLETKTNTKTVRTSKQLRVYKTQLTSKQAL